MSGIVRPGKEIQSSMSSGCGKNIILHGGVEQNGFQFDFISPYTTCTKVLITQSALNKPCLAWNPAAVWNGIEPKSKDEGRLGLKRRTRQCTAPSSRLLQ